MRYSILQCLLIIRFFLIQYIVHKNTVHIISLFDQSDGPTIYDTYQKHTSLIFQSEQINVAVC